jgi:hypothetical protein
LEFFMSDGPHRSLPLRHAWKELAKRADKKAFDSQDVIDAIGPALERDCAFELSKEFMERLRTLCLNPTPLFDSLANAEIEALKRLSAGRGSLGSVVADFTAQLLAEGKSGGDAVCEAMKLALHDRALRNARQIEEHYCRESSNRRAADVRSRIESAITRAGLDALAQRLAQQPAASTAAPPKHQSIDDGVTLS